MSEAIQNTAREVVLPGSSVLPVLTQDGTRREISFRPGAVLKVVGHENETPVVVGISGKTVQQISISNPKTADVLLRICRLPVFSSESDLPPKPQSKTGKYLPRSTLKNWFQCLSADGQTEDKGGPARAAAWIKEHGSGSILEGQ